MNYFLKMVSPVVVLAIILSIQPLQAKDEQALDVRVFLEKIKTEKKILVSNLLAMTGSESKAFWPVYNSYQEKLSLFRVQTKEVVEEFVSSYDTMTNEKANKLIDKHLTIQKEQLALADEYLPQFRKALPARKLALYYQLENKIDVALKYKIALEIPLLH